MKNTRARSNDAAIVESTEICIQRIAESRPAHPSYNGFITALLAKAVSKSNPPRASVTFYEIHPCAHVRAMDLTLGSFKDPEAHTDVFVYLPT